MEHIRLFDWCKFENCNRRANFVEEADLDNSVTERLIRNKFRDPSLPDCKDEERKPVNINWAKIFSSKRGFSSNKLYVPGLQPVTKYPKISALSHGDLFVIVKLLAQENPSVMSNLSIYKPNRYDRKRYLEIKETYENEQKEYINWARTMWQTTHSIKALKPHRVLEIVYDAIFEFHFNMTLTYPRNFEMASMVQLRDIDSMKYEISLRQTLINVPICELPEAHYPSLEEKYTIFKNNPKLPKPCMRHPCRFILPQSSEESELDLSDLHEELGQYAIENNIQCIVSEETLCCLLELNRYWIIPVSASSNGDHCTTFVIGNEIYNRRQPARYRTNMAMHYLLHTLLLKDSHKKSQVSHKKAKLKVDDDVDDVKKSTPTKRKAEKDIPIKDELSDDSDGGLVMDFDHFLKHEESVDDNEMQKDDTEESKEDNFEEPQEDFEEEEREESPPVEETISPTKLKDIPKLSRSSNKCMCKGSPDLPRRSYKVWRFEKSNGHGFDAIVHSPHRCQMYGKELLMEPIAEYQLDLGASCQNENKLRSLALSLLLRRDANLVNVRIDALTGDLVHYEHLNLSDLMSKYNNNVIDEAANILYTTLSQLQRLLPGQYLLQHEPNLGANARLHVLRPLKQASRSMIFDNAKAPVPNEAELAELSIPPTLCPVFLPMNKYRRIAPLAFSSKEVWVTKQVEVKQKKPISKKAKKKAKKKK